MKDNRVWILDFYPILSGVINAVILCCLVFYLLLKGWRYNPIFRFGAGMGALVWLLNAGFTIGASSAALRFQSFPIILTSTFVLLLIDWLIQVMNILKKEGAMHKNKSEQQRIENIYSRLQPASSEH